MLLRLRQEDHHEYEARNRKGQSQWYFRPSPGEAKAGQAVGLDPACSVWFQTSQDYRETNGNKQTTEKIKNSKETQA